MVSNEESLALSLFFLLSPCANIFVCFSLSASLPNWMMCKCGWYFCTAKCSPVSPLLRNWIMYAERLCPLALMLKPSDAVVLPLPSPV